MQFHHWHGNFHFFQMRCLIVTIFLLYDADMERRCSSFSSKWYYWWTWSHYGFHLISSHGCELLTPGLLLISRILDCWWVCCSWSHYGSYIEKKAFFQGGRTQWRNKLNKTEKTLRKLVSWIMLIDLVPMSVFSKIEIKNWTLWS